MSRFDGTLALKLDFGEMAATVTTTSRASRAVLRLAPAAGRVSGGDKYRILEHRRHQAQISARRLLDRLDLEG
jgi:hypothetical protein